MTDMYVFDDGCCPHGGLVDLDAVRAEARAESEAKVAALREALADIAVTGSDCPAAMSPESFYRSQLHHAIGTAARALVIEGSER